MNAESVRDFLRNLPHVVEARQWGDNLLFWVGDKAIGGKMCAILDLGGNGSAVSGIVGFPVPPEHFAELVEREDITPSKYLARLSWVSVHRWDVFRTLEWHDELRAAHTLTLAKLTPKARTILALPKTEQRRVIAERRKLLAAREAAKQAAEVSQPEKKHVKR